MKDSERVESKGFGRLARDSALFASGAAVGKVLGLVLLPVLTRLLPQAEYGRYDLLSTAQSAGASLMILGLDLASTRLYADLDDQDRPRMFSTWLSMVSVLATAVLAGAIVSARPLSRALFGSGDYGTAVALTGLAIFASAIQVVALTVLRNHRRPGAYAAISGGTLLANALLVIAFVPGHPSATAVLAAMSISMGLGAVAALGLVRRHLRGRPSRRFVKKLLLLGLPAAPMVAATWIAELANRTILLQRAGAVQLAYFSVAIRFSSVTLLVVLGFQMAWQPAAFALGQDERARHRIAQDGRRIMVGVIATAVLVAGAAPEIVTVLSGTQYEAAIRVVGLTLIYGILFGAYQVAIMPSSLSRRFGDIGISAVIGAGTGIGLNLWWSGNGAVGTGVAIVAGQLLGVITAASMAQLRASVPFAWPRIIGLGVVASALVLISTWPTGGAPPLLRIAVVVAFVIAIWIEGSLMELVRAVRSHRAREGRR